MSHHYDDQEFEFSGIYDEYGNAISANSAYMSSDRGDDEWQDESRHRLLPTREEMRANHGRVPRIDLHRPEKVPVEALRIVAEILATEEGFVLDDLRSAVRSGRPSPERSARLDALGRIVLHLRTVPSGASDAPSHWGIHQASATLEDIGEALGGITRDAVLRLRDRGVRLEVARLKRQGAPARKR